MNVHGPRHRPNAKSIVGAIDKDYSELCDKCTVLFFDREVLDPCRDYEQQSFRVGTSYSWTVDEVHLDYERIDTLPGLPLLQVSATAGCAFCASLRDATLDLPVHRAATVTYRLHYQDYEVDLPSKNGAYWCPYALIVTVLVGNDSNESQESYFFTFSVDSESEYLVTIWIRC